MSEILLERINALPKTDADFFLAKTALLVQNSTAKGIADFADTLQAEKAKKGDTETPFARYMQIAACVIERILPEKAKAFLEQDLKIDLHTGGTCCKTCANALKRFLSITANRVSNHIVSLLGQAAEKITQFLARAKVKVLEVTEKITSALSGAKEGEIPASRDAANAQIKEQILLAVGQIKKDPEAEKEFAQYELVKQLSKRLKFEQNTKHNNSVQSAIEAAEAARAELDSLANFEPIKSEVTPDSLLGSAQ